MKALSALLALPLLTGCTSLPPGGESLSGSKWTFTTIDGAAPKSARAGVEFLPDRISATAGCNGLGGDYSVKGNQLIAGPFVSTMMYCDGLMEQERALAALFEGKPVYRIEGDNLTLEGGRHKAVLVRAK